MNVRVWGAIFALVIFSSLVAAQKPETDLGQRLSRAGENRAELERALAEAKELRPAMEHLILGMPAADLKSIAATRLLETLRLAAEARREAPWGASLSEELWLDYVLPYANLDEPRDPWRAEFRRRFWPLVKDCKTPGEAACILNAKIFPALGVKYSTKRKRANQSPKETIEQGLASCTGLSIILANACRACGIPARLAGVAHWRKKRGNHTWVEVWDGTWHHLGAAEPSAKGLDDVWFAGDVAHAVPGSPKYAVWAATWRRTAHRFPLVWASGPSEVFAVDSTARYLPAGMEKGAGPRLLVRVRNRDGERIATPVRVVRVGSTTEKSGRSRDESADTNDILAFAMPQDGVWRIYAGEGATCRAKTWRPGEQDQETVDFVLETKAPSLGFKPEEKRSLSEAVALAFDSNLAAKGLGMAEIQAPDDLHLPARERALRDLVWSAFVSSGLGEAMKKDFDARRVVSGKHQSPYTVKDVGTRPAEGWPLVIAMHGGGGVPKDLNDSQWRQMQIYYKDHPEVGGYRYLALRAPNDSWNGFYDDYVYPLIERLVTQFLVHGDVDPNRIHVIGYSHGGYGVHAIAPKIADRFAAAHGSAAAPTDGQSFASPLRNLPFSFMIGAKDTSYGRADRCRKLNDRLLALAKDDPAGFPFAFQWDPTKDHGGLPDRDHLPRLLLHRRDVNPRVLDWKLSDRVVRHHYWLEVANPRPGPRLKARLENNRLEIEVEGEGAEDLEIRLHLDARLVDSRRPLVIAEKGKKERSVALKPSMRHLLESMAERGDPQLARTILVEL
jgi:transglutaminase-like putative cysteine protease